MSEPRLLTDEELAAIRGRVNRPGKWLSGPSHRIEALESDNWPKDAAILLGHAPADLHALLAHIDIQAGLLRDLATDSHAAARALRYRAALERIASTSPPHQGWAADVARAALEAD